MINLIFDGARHQIVNMQSTVRYDLLNSIPSSRQLAVAVVTIFASGVDFPNTNLVHVL